MCIYFPPLNGQPPPWHTSLSPSSVSPQPRGQGWASIILGTWLPNSLLGSRLPFLTNPTDKWGSTAAWVNP